MARFAAPERFRGFMSEDCCAGCLAFTPDAKALATGHPDGTIQGAVVLMITDGLDRDAGTGLAHEMDRLHRSCRRLVWLNPLLRYEGFEPRSLGMQAMMPYVDEFRPVHNLDSLETLIEVLSAPITRRGTAASLARQKEEKAA